MSRGSTPDYIRVARFLRTSGVWVPGLTLSKELGIELNTVNRCINDIRRKGKVPGLSVLSRRMKDAKQCSEHLAVHQDAQMQQIIDDYTQILHDYPDGHVDKDRIRDKITELRGIG